MYLFMGKQITFLPVSIVSDSDQEDLCGRSVGEHDHRGCEAVFRPV